MKACPDCGHSCGGNAPLCPKCGHEFAAEPEPLTRSAKVARAGKGIQALGCVIILVIMLVGLVAVILSIVAS